MICSNLRHPVEHAITNNLVDVNLQQSKHMVNGQKWDFGTKSLNANFLPVHAKFIVMPLLNTGNTDKLLTLRRTFGDTLA